MASYQAITEKEWSYSAYWQTYVMEYNFDRDTKVYLSLP